MPKPHATVHFEKTLQQLRKYCEMPVVNDRDKAGIIQAFEFTFEQSWLAIQKLLSPLGIKAPSPKQAFSEAMSQGWIDPNEESHWLSIIQDRNLTSHTYKPDLADEILKKIMTLYLPLFEKLLGQLKR